MSEKPMYPNIIAIDGPAASGKSTLGEKIAERLGYLYFDTGVMYRAVTLAAMQKLGGVDQEFEVSRMAESLQIDVFPPSKMDGRKYDVMLEGKDVTWEIRTQQVEANVSQVSAYPDVRKAMTAQQRRIGLKGNVVMVGRDIGTVVCPEAEVKIYLDASVEERARRRFNEQVEHGSNVELKDILSSMRHRDQVDSTRTVAPLRPAPDAHIIQSDNLGQDEVVNIVLKLITRK